ncbi:DUF3802 family protein [Colwellia maritima]
MTLKKCYLQSLITQRSDQQTIFIKEFSSLIKNLFDTEINELLTNNQ